MYIRSCDLWTDRQTEQPSLSPPSQFRFALRPLSSASVNLSPHNLPLQPKVVIIFVRNLSSSFYRDTLSSPPSLRRYPVSQKTSILFISHSLFRELISHHLPSVRSLPISIWKKKKKTSLSNPSSPAKIPRKNYTIWKRKRSRSDIPTKLLLDRLVWISLYLLYSFIQSSRFLQNVEQARCRVCRDFGGDSPGRPY